MLRSGTQDSTIQGLGVVRPEMTGSEAATGGGLALLKTGDRVRIDLNKRTANILISKEELEKRRKALEKAGGFKIPESQTPWQEIQRNIVGELSEGMVLKPAVKYQKIDKLKGLPRDNH
jgi:dihydroxy-acid dehydratase